MTITKAPHVTTARINGQPFLGPSEQSDLLDDLRGALRRYTLPKEDVPDPEQLEEDNRNATALRARSRYLELLRMLPTLLGQVTATALSGQSDIIAHNLTFGPGNLALYEVGANIELGNPGEASTMAQPLIETPPQGAARLSDGTPCIDPT